MGICIVFSIYFADFSKCALEYFLSWIYLPYTHLVNMFLWMKHATIIKACWFYMPYLNVFQLIRWNEEELPEHEAVSDEDSDEEDRF